MVWGLGLLLGLRFLLNGGSLLARVGPCRLFRGQLLGELVRFPEEGVCGVGRVLLVRRGALAGGLGVVQVCGLERLLGCGV